MYRLLPLLLFLLLTNAFISAQDQSISEYDLYGYWVLEEPMVLGDTQSQEKRIYTKNSEESFKEKKYGIVFVAYGKCKIVNTQNWICGSDPYKNDLTWTYDQKSNLISIYSGEMWLKQFKEYAPEEYAKFGSPERFDRMKLQVNIQSDGAIVLENYAQQRL